MSFEERGSADRRSAQRLLSMVSALHNLGYQRLRIIPGMSPSGLHWRCTITPSSNVAGPQGLAERQPAQLVARYTTGDANAYFGWPDATEADPLQLAVLFLEKFPEIARAAAGEDRAYATWFQEMLRLVEHGFFPVAYSDNGDDLSEFLPLTSADMDSDTEAPNLRVPPPPLLDGAPMIEVDLTATRTRLRKLRRYVADNLLDLEGDFICGAHAACSSSCRPGDAFREGTMSHVGRRFDLRLGGKPLRVVVVGRESGWPKDPQLQHLARRVTLEDRFRQVHDGSGLQRRYYSEPGHPGRNPHMRGTTSALRVILGRGLGADYEGELVHPNNGRAFHLFDGFALVNRLLCSAGPPGSSQGRPTSQMFSNCGSHFAKTMSILQPTLMIVQGSAVAKGVNQQLTPEQRHGEHLHEARIEGERVLICTFSHPSAHGSLRWGDRIDAPYLTDVVVPTLHDALLRL